MATSTKTLSERADLIEGRVGPAFRRRRHVYGPPVLAVVMVLVATLVWWASLQWLFNIIAVILWVIGVFGATNDLPLAADERWWRRYQERLYGWLAWTLGAAWMILAWYWGPFQPWGEHGPRWYLVVALGVILVPFWVLWFKHRRIRRSVEVDQMMAAWGDGTNAGMPGVRIVGVRATGTTITGKMKGIRGKHTWSTFQHHKPQIASRFGVLQSQIQLHRGKEEAECSFTILVGEEESLRFELPAAGESITVPKLIGRAAAGMRERVTVQLYRHGHGAIDALGAGMKGSGKSNLAEVLAAYGVRAPDALVWVCDFKPGAQQWRPWALAGLLDWFAHTQDEADRMFAVLQRVMGVRGQTAGRIHKPSKKSPLILLIVDEAALLFSKEALPADAEFDERRAAERRLDDRNAVIGDILKVSRSMGIGMLMFAQRIMADTLGTSDIRSFLAAGLLWLFRGQKTSDARMIADLGMEDVDPAAISKSAPGRAYAQLTGEGYQLIDTIEMTEDLRDQLFREMVGVAQPSLQGAELTAAGADYRNRNRSAPEPAAGQMLVLDAEVDEDLDVPRRAASADDSRRQVHRALATFGIKGAGPKALADKMGKSEQLVKGRLNELLELGAVKHAGRRAPWIAVSWPEDPGHQVGNDE